MVLKAKQIIGTKGSMKNFTQFGMNPVKVGTEKLVLRNFRLGALNPFEDSHKVIPKAMHRVVTRETKERPAMLLDLSDNPTRLDR